MDRNTYALIGFFIIGCVLGISKQHIKFMDFTQIIMDNYINDEILANFYTASCSKDPENDMTPVEIIRKNGYPVEEHFVTSKDGYILALHRIPGPKGSRAVFLYHGLYDSSMAFIVNGRERGLAYILANKGYDVWMGNARGNAYSKKHVKLSSSDPEYWNFSWHEMGKYDLPAEIEYITAMKNDTLTYVGFSMGNTIFFVMANERPDVAAKVRAMMALGPTGHPNNIKGLFAIVINFFDALEKVTDGHYELYPQNSLFNWVGKCVCNMPGLREICRDVIFSVTGYNEKNFNLSLLPLIITHLPSGTSLKNLFHYAQIYKDKRFQKYNYGPEMNLRIYNNTQPPVYELEKVQTPVALFYGANDFLTTPEDVEQMYKEFPKRIGLYKAEDPNFNHLDFVYGYNTPKLIYSKIIKIMEKY